MAIKYRDKIVTNTLCLFFLIHVEIFKYFISKREIDATEAQGLSMHYFTVMENSMSP